MLGMLAQSYEATGVGLMKFTIEHYMVEMGCFSREGFGNFMKTWYYSDTLMHTNLYMAKDITRENYGWIKSVNVEEPQTYAVHICDK